MKIKRKPGCFCMHDEGIVDPKYCPVHGEPTQKVERIYELLSGKVVEVIKLLVNYGDGVDVPIHTAERYYTKDGILIGENHPFHQDSHLNGGEIMDTTKEKINKCYKEVNCEFGVGCTHFILDPDKVLELTKPDLTRVGMLRQWLNEDRIKDADRFVTNEDILEWLASTKK